MNKKFAVKKTRTITKRTTKKTTKKRSLVKKSIPLIMESDTTNVSSSKALTSFESAFDTSFFYTNDKFIDSIDDNQVMQFIRLKYPELKTKNTDVLLRKHILKFLDDEKFVEKVLKFYSLTTYDLIKIMSKNYGPLFKGQFLKKILNLLKKKNYAAKYFK